MEAETPKELEASQPDPAGFSAWVMQCLDSGTEQRILRWLSSTNEATALAVGAHRNAEVLRLLERHSEWGILGRLLSDPLALFKAELTHVERTLGQIPEWFSEDQAQQTAQTLRQMLRFRAAAFHRGLSAANRILDAHNFATEVRKLDGSPEMDAALKGR